MFPHLLLMAFFQRVLNGGARLTREAAVGRDATQTLVIFDRTPSGRAMPWEERLRWESHGNVVVRWL